MKSLLLRRCVFVMLIVLPSGSFCQIIASGDTTICQGGTAQLSASGGGVSYFWSSYPTDPSLLIPQDQNPVVSPTVSTMYIVQSNIATGNLILNGTFELGVMGFSSEYVNNQQSIYEEGTYAVVNDAHTVHPNFYCNEDHTTGSGKFMAVNGAEQSNVKVWYLILNNVEPNARYEFSTWITSLHATNPAILQFSINGQLMGQPFQAYPNTCDWYQFFHIWDADTNSQATISIVNQNTVPNGNDFALDDISFATVLVYYDTVWVEVLPQFNALFSSPTSACAQEVINVVYEGNAPDTADFNWDFGGATIFSGSGAGPYEIAYPLAGNPSISLWVDGDGCASDTTTQALEIGESPAVSVYADNTILPYGSSTILHGSYTGGLGPYEYSWSPSELLVDAGVLDPQTIPLEITAAFILSVTDQAAGCTGYDTVIIQVAGGPLGVNIFASHEEICLGGQSVLTAEGLGGTGSYTYSWESDPPGFISGYSSVTVQPDVTTEYTVTVNDGLSWISESVTVIVKFNPSSNAGMDQVIAYGTPASLQGTGSNGSGSYSYHWEPAALVTNPDTCNPQTVNMISTTVFILVVTDLNTGCISEPDEVIVEVIGGPLSVTIYPDKPAICKGDTAVLTAFASGGNQGSYTYTWTDNLGNSYPPSQQISVSPDDTLAFHVTVDDFFNQIGDDFTLIVHPSAEFDWTGGQDVITACPYDSVVLKPDPHPQNWSYLWSNGAGVDQISIGATGIGFSMQTFTLKTTTPDGCEFSKSVTVIFDFSYCYGIDEENQDTPVSILPNPNKGRFRILIKNPGILSEVSLFSAISGKVFRTSITGENHEIEVYLPGVPAGLYILHLQGSSCNLSQKVIINP